MRHFNGYVRHAIKTRLRVHFHKASWNSWTDLGSLFGSHNHVSPTVRYLMYSWSVSRYRCVLSSRRDRVTLRAWMAALQWQAESAGCQHLWQPGNQGQRSPMFDLQLPVVLRPTPPLCILTGLLFFAYWCTFSGTDWILRTSTRKIPNTTVHISFNLYWQGSSNRGERFTLFAMCSVVENIKMCQKTHGEVPNGYSTCYTTQHVTPSLLFSPCFLSISQHLAVNKVKNVKRKK